jgi:Kinesin motor domain
MVLDVLFQSVSSNMVHPTCANTVFPSLAASDVSEAEMLPAATFIENMWGEGQSVRGSMSRAQTPLLDTSYLSIPTIPSSRSHQKPPRISNLPTSPAVPNLRALIDPSFEYALVVSMYEVYNDRIFDLLAGQTCTTTTRMGTPRRRALLFKSTEMSPQKKVVAGLRKIVCCTLEEALMVLEAGLLERKVAGTGSNAVSSRSHGFFCVEIKKRHRVHKAKWESSTMTIVDLAGKSTVLPSTVTKKPKDLSEPELPKLLVQRSLKPARSMNLSCILASVCECSWTTVTMTAIIMSWFRSDNAS